MRSRQGSARTLLGEESDLATVLRGAGLHRVLASAVGFASVVLPARWTGSSQYGLYTFAVVSMTLLAYPATLGLRCAFRGGCRRLAARAGFHAGEFMVAFGSRPRLLTYRAARLTASEQFSLDRGATSLRAGEFVRRSIASGRIDWRSG